MATVLPAGQDAILPKSCLYCDRRFLKAEHLKRHQRSHTGERPYKCIHCSKRFSRSDVLTRHTKAHAVQAVDVGVQAVSSPSEHESMGDQEQSGVAPSNPMTLLTQRPGGDGPQTLVGDRRSEAVLQYATLPNFVESSSPQQSQQILQELVVLATQPQTEIQGEAAAEPTATQKTPNPLPTDRDRNWGNDSTPSDQSVNNHVGGNENMLFSVDPNFGGISMYPSPSAYFTSHRDPDLNRSGATQFDDMLPSMNALGQANNTVMTNEMQMWLEQFDCDTLLNADNLAMFGNRTMSIAETVGNSSVFDDGQRVESQGFGSPHEAVPNERFTKVQKCWPTRQYIGPRLMPDLWHEICFMAEVNVFMKPGSTFEHAGQGQRDGSRWGLDMETKARIEAYFGNISKAQRRQDLDQQHNILAGRVGQPENSSLETAGMDSTLRLETTPFPPPEIFDIGLDLYFRHFHPLLPFVHIPTFNPRTTSVPILFLMCLIGLMIMNTKGATLFVKQNFSKTLDIIEAELSSHALRVNTSPAQAMGTFACGVLVLSLAEFLGETANKEKCQRLYVQLMTQAQEQKLFASGISQQIQESIYEPISDPTLRWEAWSRVESCKRLIICILMADSWFSSIHHSCPLIRTESIHLTIPCAAALFQAKSATKWLEILSKGSPSVMPVMALSPQKVSILELTKSPDSFDLQGIFCAIRLCISEDYHRLLSGNRHRPSDEEFVPWRSFMGDDRAQNTKRLVLKVVETEAGASLLNAANPNCTALWHNMCMMLAADFRIFERSAGCEGASVARQALEDISVWTRTTAARRAIIHAAQTFKLMSNRRVSDGDPFHASHGLFLSALVLGLYVFMLPPRPTVIGEKGAFELMDEINWTLVGDEGFVDSSHYVDEPAVEFIRDGGGMSLSGVVHEGGYLSARRILLDFAHLLEDVGRWKAGRYTRVLRIMSDALVDVESITV